MPTLWPWLVLLVTTAFTATVALASTLARVRWHARLAKTGAPHGFSPRPVPPRLDEKIAPHLPHKGAATILARDVLGREDRLVVRVDYTLGSVGPRRNVTRIVALSGEQVHVAPVDQTRTAQYEWGMQRVMADPDMPTN